MRYKRSIANDYFFISAIFLIGLMALSISFSLYIYKIETKKLYSNLTIAAINAERVIEESFDYSTQLASFVGSTILEEDTDKYKRIAGILSGKLVANPIAKSLFSYTIFDWVNVDKKMVISGPYGILKEPRDVSFRNYAKKGPLQPWQLHFDEPTKGIPSGQEILPAGMGLTDKSGKFHGILSMGFNLYNLNKAIKQEINDPGIKYIILSASNKLVLHSGDGSQLPLLKINNLLTSQNETGFLKQQFNHNGDIYVYYQRLSNYPFSILIGYGQTEFNSELYATLLIRIVELFSIGITCLFLLLITRKKIIHPIITLSDVADQISRGATNPEIPKFYSFEMNILAEQLQNVLTYTHQLEQKVNDRTIQLEQALESKNEFLNNISHEIRTPIQGMSVISSGLVEHWNNLHDNNKHNLAVQIANNAKRLASLVGNLLDLSKFNAGKMILDLRKVNLVSLIDDIIDECKVLYINTKQITIYFNFSDTAEIIADQEKISQVLRNLLVNSIKFSPYKGSITVELKEAEMNYSNGSRIAAYQISVIDEGLGIPENELEAIFTPFTQSSLTKTKAGGTGLGLAICRKIIEAHHGKIWAENNKKVGACFNCLIPNMNNHVLIYEKNVSLDENLKPKPANILVIDDEEACLISMELLLKGTCYNLVTINNGHQAIKYLQSNPYSIDLIFLDLMMPDMYGLDVLAEIKGDQRFSRIPVILQTGASDQSEIEKAYQMGIDCYIRKPYEKSTIISEIAKVLK